MLQHCKTIREREIVWKFRHGAVCTPKLAYHMGLRLEKKCFFCKSVCHDWKHLLLCAKFDQMWASVKCIVEKAGFKWNSKFLFSGNCSAEYKAVNHLLHVAYMVVYEYIIFEINKFKYKFNPPSRYKQLLFEMLYLDFKISCDSEQSRIAFDNYWQKVSFLYKITGRYIDIRI